MCKPFTDVLSKSNGFYFSRILLSGGVRVKTFFTTTLRQCVVWNSVFGDACYQSYITAARIQIVIRSIRHLHRRRPEPFPSSSVIVGDARDRNYYYFVGRLPPSETTTRTAKCYLYSVTKITNTILSFWTRWMAEKKQ